MSDLVWLDTKPYDPVTGIGSIGVEFAGTAVSSSGFGGTIANASAKAAGYYRGYFELHISKEEAVARFYGECRPSFFLQRYIHDGIRSCDESS